MPQLLPATEARLTAQALEVFKIITETGISQEAACAKVGISREQFRHWISKNDEAIQEIRRNTNELYKRQIVMILSAQEKLLSNLIADAQSDNIDPKERLAILQYLDKRLEILSNQFNARGIEEDAAHNYLLQGPALKKGQSRLRGSTINVRPLPDGSVDVTTYHEGEIIDSQFLITTDENHDDQ